MSWFRGYAVANGTRVGVGLTATMTLLLVCLGAAGYRVNISGSLPLGVYRIESASREVARGSIVLVCLPMPIATLAHRRGYVPRGGRCGSGLVPVGKIVVAVAGDTVSVSATGVTVNGAVQPCSRPLVRDHAGRMMPRLLAGARVLGPDSVWLLAPSDRSFDSRYFGAVRRVDIVTRIHPIWGWTDGVCDNSWRVTRVPVSPR